MTLPHDAAAQQQVQAQQAPALPPVEPPAKPRRRHAVDVSNYTDTLTVPVLHTWAAHHDIGLVIVQVIAPPVDYPPGVTRQQIQTCAAAGMPTDAYFYLWTNSNIEQDMRTKLSLLNGLELHVRRLWLDVEDVSAAAVATRIRAIRQALAVLDGWSVAHDKPLPGIYTGQWYAMSYLGGTTEFAGRDLWDSNYDRVDDARAFTPYSGWLHCAIKQYQGTSVLAGIDGVDLDVLSDAELASLP